MLRYTYQTLRLFPAWSQRNRGGSTRSTYLYLASASGITHQSCRYEWSQRWSNNANSLVSSTDLVHYVLYHTVTFNPCKATRKGIKCADLHLCPIRIEKRHDQEWWTHRCWPPTCQSFFLVCTRWSQLLSSAQRSIIQKAALRKNTHFLSVAGVLREEQCPEFKHL